MKNLCLKYLVALFVTQICNVSYGQNYVTWNFVPPPHSGNAVIGTAGIVNVFTTQSSGIPIAFQSPAANQNNLIVNGAQTFSTIGSTNQGVSSDLIFNFDRPVIITRYNMVDIDLGFSWDDSFIFNGINFSNNPAPVGVNVTANLAGATATIDVGRNAENASWFCSNPITTFTIDYQTNNGLTHAFLGYSIEVLLPPVLPPICLNELAPDFPVVGNGIVGIWSPNIISTDVVGDLVYTFTPNVGQPIQCPIEMTVSVIDCCQPTLLSSTTIALMIHEERGDWISSSDLITFSDGVVGNGVVYHAENFVELTEGFEAIYGSQFAAYPLGCSNTFVYKNNPIKSKEIIKNEIQVNQGSPKIMNLTPNPVKDIIKISMINNYLSHIKISSLDGKIIYSNNFDDLQFAEIDLSSIPAGVYIVHVVNSYGGESIEKIIKN